MLKISLRANGSVTIGDNIKIYNGEDFAVRIAIDAPKDIPILRDEAKTKQKKVS